MSGYLWRLLDYNAWANQGLLDLLAELPADTLDLATAGVYGTIAETFQHMLTSELSYSRRLASLPPVEAPAGTGPPGLPMLQRLAGESAERLAKLADLLPEPERMIQTRDGMRSAATHLAQLFMHGCEHRAHIATILGANGIEPPDLDAWAFGILVGGDDWPPDWGPDRRNEAR